MGRDIINSIKCGHCGKKFDVATEDIEWEHLEDRGECDDDNTLRDYAVEQKTSCPHCHKENSILMTAKGKSEIECKVIEVISMEYGAYKD